MSVKRRYREYRRNYSRDWEWPSPEPSTWTIHTAHGMDDLVTSQGHPYRKLGESDSDIGGDFKVVKMLYSESSNVPDIIHSWPPPHAGGYHYKGGGQWAVEASVDINSGYWPDDVSSSNDELDILGTQIIANVIPTNPVAGLAQALGELYNDGLPSVVGSSAFKERLRRLKNTSGEEYLNVEFGWKPLLNDLNAFSNALSNEETLLKQYVRNSGKRIKRRVTLPTEVTSEEQNYSGQYAQPILASPLYAHPEGDLKITTTVERKRWFSGCFTYYLPPLRDGESWYRNAQLRNYLLGTRVTPETLWNLTPWSWAADWVADTGSVLHNLSAFQNDGLVMPYAYVMEEVISTRTYRLSGVEYRYPQYPTTMYQTFTIHSKARRKATPFGFGLTGEDLNPRQVAILVALGLTLL